MNRSRSRVSLVVVACVLLGTVLWFALSLQFATYNTENEINPNHWFDRFDSWQYGAMHALTVASGSCLALTVWLYEDKNRHVALRCVVLSALFGALWLLGLLIATETL